MNRFHESGQIGLIVLLISAVMMTIGLGVASQSVFESKSARQEEESTQTFNAAEQGIEESLKAIAEGVEPFNYNGISGFRRTEFVEMISDMEVLPGHSLNVNLFPGGDDFSVTWSDASNCNSEIIATVIYSGGTIQRLPYRGAGCADVTGFTNAGVTCSGGVRSLCTVTIPVNANAALARIKVVRAPSTLTIQGTLPVQAHQVTSTATNMQNETTTLDVTKSIAALPSIFDYVLFSGNNGIQ